MSDTGWRRLLYVGAGLSLVAMAILILFVIPPFKKGIVPGSNWILPGIQLFITAIFFGAGYMNRRDGCLTRIILFIVGIGLILLGLMGFMIVAKETEMTYAWKIATRICAIDEIIIGVMAFFACF
jgi:hypothetical protein